MKLMDRNSIRFIPKSETDYLCKIDNMWMAGKFEKQTWGWIFVANGDCTGYQLDGEDGSTFQTVYEIGE